MFNFVQKSMYCLLKEVVSFIIIQPTYKNQHLFNFIGVFKNNQRRKNGTEKPPQKTPHILLSDRTGDHHASQRAGIPVADEGAGNRG